MKTLFFMLYLSLCFPLISSAQFQSAEQTLKKASDLETWRQQLRYHEQRLKEQEQTVIKKLEEAQTTEQATRQALRQQQEQAKAQAFQSQLRQQQETAQRREAELTRQLEAQRDLAARDRLQQQMT